ncbi:GntR family transcriptional regulator [Parasphingorhabdus pacifica]
MVLRRLEPSARMGDQVFEAIHAAILNGELPAGYRLRIRDLADELGTSVMPVREAIRRLQDIGLADSAPYKGAVVKSFTSEELLHVYAVRRLLEVDAAKRGATEVSANGLARLEGEYRSMERAVAEGRVVEYLDHDEEFLSFIYEASGNPVLLETIRTLWHRCRSYKIVGAQTALDSGESERLLMYQKSLLKALTAGDPQTAADMTRESLDVATSRIREALPATSAED